MDMLPLAREPPEIRQRGRIWVKWEEENMLEMDLKAEQGQIAEGVLQVVVGEPDKNEDSPEEELTYSQAEVEEIIREHLLRFQSLPV